MKKLLSLLFLLFTITFSNAQSESDVIPFNPPNPAPNITPFGGALTSISFAGFEYGGLAGVSIKDIILIGGYSQFNLHGDNFSGLYLQGNVNPKHHWFHIGYSIKTGLINGKYLSFEPAMVVQNKINDRFKLGHSIGIVHGLPSYSFTVMIGNFGQKWWRYPYMKKYMNEYEEQFRSYYLK